MENVESRRSRPQTPHDGEPKEAKEPSCSSKEPSFHSSLRASKGSSDIFAAGDVRLSTRSSGLLDAATTTSRSNFYQATTPTSIYEPAPKNIEHWRPSDINLIDEEESVDTEAPELTTAMLNTSGGRNRRIKNVGRKITGFGVATITQGFVIFTLSCLVQFAYVEALMFMEDTLDEANGGADRRTVMIVPVAASLLTFILSIIFWGWSTPNTRVGTDGVLMAIGLTAEMYCFALVRDSDVREMDGLRGSGVIALLFAAGCRMLLLLFFVDSYAQKSLILIIFSVTLYLRLGVKTASWEWLIAFAYCSALAPIWPSNEHHSANILVSALLTAPMLALDHWQDIWRKDCLLPILLATGALTARQMLHTVYLSSDPRITLRLAPTIVGACLAFPIVYQGRDLVLVGVIFFGVIFHAWSK